MMQKEFSERDIHLALDGELPDDEAAAFEQWLERMRLMAGGRLLPRGERGTPLLEASWELLLP